MLDPIFEASTAIQIHIMFACFALVLGPIALFRKRRDRVHKITGYIWIGGIVGLSVSSIWIPSSLAILGYFGPIHLLSLYGLWGVIEGWYHVRHGNIARHRATMQSVWFGGMGLAGLFTLLPGRTMNRVVFGGPSDAGYWVVGIGVFALVLFWRSHLGRVST